MHSADVTLSWVVVVVVVVVMVDLPCASTLKVMPSISTESFEVGWVWPDTKCKFTESFGRVNPNQREDQLVGQSRAEEVEVATLSEGAGNVVTV